MAKKHWDHKVRLLDMRTRQYVTMKTGEIARAIAGANGKNICKRISLYCYQVMAGQKTLAEIKPLFQKELDKLKLKCKKHYVLDSVVSEPYLGKKKKDNVIVAPKKDNNVTITSDEHVQITMVIPRSMMCNGKATFSISID